MRMGASRSCIINAEVLKCNKRRCPAMHREIKIESSVTDYEIKTMFWTYEPGALESIRG